MKLFKSVTTLIYLTALSVALVSCSSEAPPQSGQSAGAPRAVGVVVETLSEQTISDITEALGTARANESAVITTKVAEKISHIAFEDGQTVKRGDLIVRLDDASERAALSAAKARLTEKKRNLKRVEQLLKQDVVSPAQLDTARSDLEAAEADAVLLQQSISDRMIRAPFSGRLGLREVSVGSFVQPGDLITTLNDISSLKIDFTVPASALKVLVPGGKITATSAGMNGEKVDGVVNSIATQIDPVTRSITARAVITNDDEKLRPGQLFEVQVRGEERRGLSVSEAALIPKGKQQFIYVVKDGKISQQEVGIGVRRNGRVELINGAAAGDQVVVEGLLKVRPGAPVKILGTDNTDGK